MKKSLKIILTFAAIIIILYEILGFTGIFKVYSNPTIANEPNLKFKSKMFVSNLKDPQIGDFVCYKYEDEMLGKHIRVHRLCAFENDIIEIRDGIVFRNEQNIDSGINYVHFYKLSLLEFESIKDSEKITENSFASSLNENTVKVLLEDSFAESYGFTHNRIIDSIGKSDRYISAVFGKNWNKDNLGPLTIPRNKIFVIGDNRDNSEDSRTVGLIDKSDIVGVVLK